MPKKFSEVEFEILAVLSRTASMLPMEIANASAKIKTGSVYVYLARLKDKKWVRSFKDGAATPLGTPTQRYSITGIGSARYRSFKSDNPWMI
jgi:DNA-binding PadR family transcriptional regulator